MNLYSMKITIYFPNLFRKALVINVLWGMELIHSILGKISQHIYYYNCHLIWQCINQQDNTVFNLSADFD